MISRLKTNADKNNSVDNPCIVDGRSRTLEAAPPTSEFYSSGYATGIGITLKTQASGQTGKCYRSMPTYSSDTASRGIPPTARAAVRCSV